MHNFSRYLFPDLEYVLCCLNRACSAAKKPVSPLAQPMRAASFHTFAENKGEVPTAIRSGSLNHPKGLIRFLVPKFTLGAQPSRGFKSRRGAGGGGVPFKDTTEAAINDYRYQFEAE